MKREQNAILKLSVRKLSLCYTGVKSTLLGKFPESVIITFECFGLPHLDFTSFLNASPAPIPILI